MTVIKFNAISTVNLQKDETVMSLGLLPAQINRMKEERKIPSTINKQFTLMLTSVFMNHTKYEWPKPITEYVILYSDM